MGSGQRRSVIDANAVVLPRFERRLCRRNLGGRFGRGAEPPSERKDAVAFVVLIVVLLVQVAGWLPWRVAEEA